MNEILAKFVASYSVYKPFSLYMNIVEKVFNRGMGAIALFRFYWNEKIILINETFYTKGDRKKLNEFIVKNNLSDFEIRFKRYGYPDYYRRDFRL